MKTRILSVFNVTAHPLGTTVQTRVGRAYTNSRWGLIAPNVSIQGMTGRRSVPNVKRDIRLFQIVRNAARIMISLRIAALAFQIIFV